MKGLLIGLLIVGALPVMAADVAGEYAAHVPEVASGLLLRPDKSFAYFFTYGAADYMATGSWKQEGDAVMLTSDGADREPFRLSRTAAGNARMVRVSVKAPNGRGVAHMDVKLVTSAGTLEARTDQDGTAEFETDAATQSVSLHVPVYDVDAGPFEIAAGNRDITFEIDGDAITTLPFKNERLRMVKGGGLEMTYWKGEKPLVYFKR